MTSKTVPRLPERLPRDIATVLRSYRRKEILWRLGKDLSIALLLGGCFLLAAMFFDRFVDVQGKWRVPLPIIAAALWSVLAIRLLRRVCRRPDYDRIAWALDRSSADSRDHLRSVLDCALQSAPENFFTSFSRRKAIERWQNLDAAALAPTHGAKPCLAAAFFFLIGLAILWQFPDFRADLLWRRFWHPLGNHMRPSATWFDIQPLPKQPLRTGDDLRIRANLMGRKKERPVPLLRIETADGASTTQSLTLRPDGTWETELKNLKQDFAWHLFMEDARSERYPARVLPRPTIVQATVSYDFPEYALMKSKTEILLGRTITALEGTRIKLKIASNVELAEAVATSEEESYRFRIIRQNTKEAVAHLILSKNQKIKPDLVSVDGVRSKEELPFNLRAISDNAPTVSIKNQGQLDGQSFYFSDFFEVEYRAQDDLGLSEVYLLAEPPRDRYPDASTTRTDIPLESHGTRLAEGLLRLSVSDQGPGGADEIRLRVLTLDTKEQESSSPTLTLKIASDSFDRQLRFLFKSYRGDPQSHAPENRGEPSLSQHERMVSALKTARAKLAILLHSLEDNEPLGPAHSEIVQALSGEIASLGYPFPYGTYWFFDFQNAAFLPRFRRAGETAVLWSRLESGAPHLPPLLAQALQSANPKAELQRFSDLLGRAADQQAKILERVRTDYRDSKRELAGYLLSSFLQSQSRAPEKSWRDPAFVASLKERLKEVLGLAESELKEECPEETLATLKQALDAEDFPAALSGLAPALERWRQALVSAAKDAALQRIPPTLSLHPPIPSPPATDRSFNNALASALYLASDNVGEDDLFLLQASYQFLHSLAGANSSQPFQPLGDPDSAVREREECAFRLFQLLQRARGQAEELRLGLACGKLRYGQPETEAQWLALREHRLALLAAACSPSPIDPALRTSIRDGLASFNSFEDWRMLSDPTPLLSALEQWEQQCGDAASHLLPHVRSLLAKINRSLSARQKEITPAIEALRGLLRAEIEYLEKSKDSIGISGIRAIKAHLKGLQTAALKTLDFAELAQIYHAENSIPLDLFSGLHLLLGKTIQEFEKRVESKAAHHSTRFGDIDLQAWSVKVQEYQALDAFLASVAALLLAEAGRPAIEGLIAGQNLAYQFQTDQDALRAALAAESSLSEPRKLLDDLLLDAKDASALWAGLFYQLHSIHQSLHRGSGTEDLRTRLDGLEREMKRLEPLPKEFERVREFLSECRQLPQDLPQVREEVASRYDALIEELRPLAQAPEPKITQHVRDFYGWIATVDLSAMTRAKIRSQQQLYKDRREIKRILSALALGREGIRPVDLYGALGESEMNRRKASLTFDQIGLGGLALSGDSLENLKLPKHLYRELERARAGQMPALFKKECYEYLNRVLQNAR